MCWASCYEVRQASGCNPDAGGVRGQQLTLVPTLKGFVFPASLVLGFVVVNWPEAC